ncbi:LuxR C-terminal-related transcriptional regulator [Glaciecola sp. 1036]|uniref:response regulator transcription factor n=1 Tax=Alteromonadaceae TaxID=72275 RepID=UPI003CFE223E
MSTLTPITLSTILVAEDHELFGDGINWLLIELFPGTRIIRAMDFDQAWITLQNNNDIDLILMDLKMPGTKGLNGIKAVKNSFPCHTLIILSSLDSTITVNQVMALGVNGFISKSTPKVRIKTALFDVLDGKNVIESPNYDENTHPLSTRLQQTLQLMSEGKSNKEIAKEMNLSPYTVKEYVSSVIKELEVENRTQAVQKAEQLGLLFDSDY